ncbi:MAG: beta-lactamase family protein [Methanoregulaceae archaeon]|nr:beta-lactamase family protein [Methanoregulaceae archaeon]
MRFSRDLGRTAEPISDAARYVRAMRAALLALTLIPTFALADEVDDLIRAEMKARQIPGASVLVTKDDKVIKRSVYGKANVELDVDMSTDSVFESGSIGKTFTAVVILQLVEEGKLSLDDPLSKHFEKAPPTWSAITLRHMLGHTTGLKDYALVPGLGLADRWTRDEWIDGMIKLPLDFPTGAAFAYSNSNYLLLGLVAEKVGGKPIMELTKERIIDKIGLKRSFVAEPLPIIPHRVSGYLKQGGVLFNGLDIAAGYGDGSLINSPEDLAAFERALREGKLLKPETVTLMQTAGLLPTGRKTGYGLGWFIRETNKVRMVTHGGNTGGFGSSIFRVPSANLTIVLMTNMFDVPGDSIAQKIAEVYVPELRPRKLAEKPDPNPTLTATLLATLQALAAGEVKDDQLDGEFAARLRTPRGQMSLRGMVLFAKVAKMAYLESEESEPDVIHRYRVSTNGKSYVVAFTVTKDGRVYSIGQREELP